MIEGLDLSRTMVLRMDHKEGMPLIMQALSSPEPVQVIANLDLEKLSQNPTLFTDPIYRELFKDRTTDYRPTAMTVTASKTQVKETIVSILRQILELNPEEQLGNEKFQSLCGDLLTQPCSRSRRVSDFLRDRLHCLRPS